MTVASIKNRSTSVDSHRAELWDNGHVLIRDLADRPELVLQRGSINDAVLRLSSENRSLKDRDTYGKAFLQVTNLWRHDATVRQFVLNRNFAQAAADLLGVEKVRLYHDQALFKEPGGGPTPWHQDKYYWPLHTEKMITMWMPLVDLREEMGVIRFASGSHKSGMIDNVEISDESEETYERFVVENGFVINGPRSMNAGDATFHLGWTIHSAGPNRSVDKMREVMTIIYFADGACVAPPTNEHQQADLKAWFPGRRSGEFADTDLNPILN